MPKAPSAFLIFLILAAAPASAQFGGDDKDKVSVPHFRRAAVPPNPTGAPPTAAQTAPVFATVLEKAATEMAAAKPGFASKVGCGNPCTIDQKFNVEFWVSVDPMMGRFGVRPDKQPADAVEDVLKNSAKYKIECATAIKLVLYTAILRTIGTGRFNAAAKKTPLEIGSGPYESLLKPLMRRALNSDNDTSFPGMARDVKGSDENFIATMKPGDGVYMVNLKSRGGAGGGWGGENALFIGKDKFFGHPLGMRTAGEIKTTLESDWDSTPGASQVRGQENGPPGFVYDIYQPRMDAIAALGR